jgi:ABC-2 type transport system ATP-binding protein
MGFDLATTEGFVLRPRSLVVAGVVVDAVGKRFGSRWVLRHLSLRVEPGTVVAMLGRNGVGKSTLLRVLGTAVLPDEGTVSVGGVDVVDDPGAARRTTGLVLGDDRTHFWRLSGRENLRFFAALAGLAGRAGREAVGQALERVGLEDVADVRVDRYSTGMRARLALARSLLGRPSVVLADEPTRSLDQVAADRARRVLRELADEDGVAVLLVTHDAAEAAAVADRTVVLAGGRVAACLGRGASPEELSAALRQASS